MYAVIQTGGKQYRVKAGDILSVEKLGLETGRKAQFDRVLLVEDGEKVQLGTPALDNAMVLAVVLENFKDKKVVVFKKKRRKQFRRTRGHRQPLTRIRVEKIVLDRTQLTAADLAPVAPAPAEAPEAKPRPKPAPKPEPRAAAAKAKTARKHAPAKAAEKPKAVRKPAAKTKKTTKE